MSHDDRISRVLSGQASYDALDDSEQAVVRAWWKDRIAERIAGLDFERQPPGAPHPGAAPMRHDDSQ